MNTRALSAARLDSHRPSREPPDPHLGRPDSPPAYVRSHRTTQSPKSRVRLPIVIMRVLQR
jgi:hypothetical protein